MGTNPPIFHFSNIMLVCSANPDKKAAFYSCTTFCALSAKLKCLTKQQEQKQQCVERHQPNKANRNIRGKKKATSFSVYH